MKCPKCRKSARVIDTRKIQLGIRRRRECNLRHRFTTYEIDSSMVSRLADAAIRLEGVFRRSEWDVEGLFQAIVDRSHSYDETRKT